MAVGSGTKPVWNDYQQWSEWRAANGRALAYISAGMHRGQPFAPGMGLTWRWMPHCVLPVVTFATREEAKEAAERQWWSDIDYRRNAMLARLVPLFEQIRGIYAAIDKQADDVASAKGET